jgi:hypothetical protein
MNVGSFLQWVCLEGGTWGPPPVNICYLGFKSGILCNLMGFGHNGHNDIIVYEFT